MVRFMHWRRGFALGDAVSLIVVLVVMASVLVAASHGARREARLAGEFAKLRRIAAYTESYAADFQDHFWGLSWQAGESPSKYQDLKFANTDKDAAGNQVIDLLRRYGRKDMLKLPGWFPYVLYSHLPLADWMGGGIPLFDFVSESDRHRWNWANDPKAFDAGAFLPYQPQPMPINQRWPYSSSFELNFGAWEQSPAGSRVYQQGTSTYMYFVPNSSNLGATLRSPLRYPSQKSLIHASNDFHSRRKGLAAFLPEARVPLAANDGSVSMRTIADCNPGWQPNNPESPNPTLMILDPAARPWEPPTVTGFPVIVDGMLRYTRGYLEGRDFGGPEVDTGQ